MGVSTVIIGMLPTYDTIGVAAPALLALCRFGQGLGLGGEWGGAVLLAVENAPPGRRAWYGMFPQLGAPFGFLFSGGVFLLLSAWLTDEQFFAFGWRIPFLSSAVLVVVGLYVRLTITETPVFREAAAATRARESRCSWCSASTDGRSCRDVRGARDVRALLPDDGVRAVVGHDGARATAARQFLDDSAVRHPVLRADDSRRRPSSPTATDAAGRSYG